MRKENIEKVNAKTVESTKPCVWSFVCGKRIEETNKMDILIFVPIVNRLFECFQYFLQLFFWFFDSSITLNYPCFNRLVFFTISSNSTREENLRENLTFPKTDKIVCVCKRVAELFSLRTENNFPLISGARILSDSHWQSHFEYIFAHENTNMLAQCAQLSTAQLDDWVRIGSESFMKESERGRTQIRDFSVASQLTLKYTRTHTHNFTGTQIQNQKWNCVI